MNGFVGFGVGAGSGFGVLDRAFVSLEAAGFSAGFADEVLRPRVGLSGAGPVELDRAESSGYSGRDDAVLRSREGLGAGLGSGLGLGAGLPLGAGATMTSSFDALASAAAAARFDSAVGLGTEAVLDTAASLGIEAARGFLALPSAAVAATSRFVCLGTDAARGGVSFCGAGVSPSFDIVLATASSVFCFILVRCAAANNSLSVFLNWFKIDSGCLYAILTLPLPAPLPEACVGGCPPCGGGAMPAGASPGPLTSCGIKSLGLVFLDIRKRCTFSAIPLMCVSFDVFPNIAFPFGVAPEPDGPDGGGCPPPCESSMG